jgi:hypothetical protein
VHEVGSDEKIVPSRTASTMIANHKLPHVREGLVIDGGGPRGAPPSSDRNGNDAIPAPAPPWPDSSRWRRRSGAAPVAPNPPEASERCLEGTELHGFDPFRDGVGAPHASSR